MLPLVRSPHRTSLFLFASAAASFALAFACDPGSSCEGRKNCVGPLGPSVGTYVGGTINVGVGGMATTGGTGGIFLGPGPELGGAGQGGQGGVAVTPTPEEQAEAWLAEQGVRCTASDAEPTSTATEPVPECAFLELKLPGVLDYSVADPDTSDEDYPGNEHGWEYLGCDSSALSCVGRLEYAWTVEYESEAAWTLSLTPVLGACDYSHLILSANEAGKTLPRAVIQVQPIVVRLNLQPTPEGYKVGSIRTLDGQLVSPLDLTTFETFTGWPETGIRTALGEAVLAHIKAQSWACTRP